MIYSLDSDDMFTGSVRKRHQARGHRAIPNFAIDEFANQDSTSAAITLATTDLRAFKILSIPYKIEHRCAGREGGLDVYVVEDESKH